MLWFEVRLLHGCVGLLEGCVEFRLGGCAVSSNPVLDFVHAVLDAGVAMRRHLRRRFQIKNREKDVHDRPTVFPARSTSLKESILSNHTQNEETAMKVQEA